MSSSEIQHPRWTLVFLGQIYILSSSTVRWPKNSVVMRDWAIGTLPSSRAAWCYALIFSTVELWPKENLCSASKKVHLSVEAWGEAFYGGIDASRVINLHFNVSHVLLENNSNVKLWKYTVSYIFSSLIIILFLLKAKSIMHNKHD